VSCSRLDPTREHLQILTANMHPDPELVEPTVHRSTLELLVPGYWEAIHG
jgi:hypothetical protein